MPRPDYRLTKINRLVTALELAVTAIEAGKGEEAVPSLLKALIACPRETQRWPMDHTKWPFFKARSRNAKS